MGRIGSELSRRAIAFGMRVVAYDPYLSATRARSLQVELVDELDDLLTSADFISLHTPLTAETHHIVDLARLQKRNAASASSIARAAVSSTKPRWPAPCKIDMLPPPRSMFSRQEPLPDDSPLRSAPNLVLTPHLGASTAEAQESVGIEIAQSIRAALLEGTIRNAVNMPNLDAKTLSIIGPHLRFGEKLGKFLSQVAPKRVDTLNINYSGKVNEVDTTAITRAVLKGFLQSAGGSEVNEVNAPAFAESLGLKITETRLERSRRLHRPARTFRRRRWQNRFRRRRIFRRDSAHRQREQPPGRSASARRHPGFGKHRPPRNGRPHRHVARRSRSKHRDDVVEPKSSRRHRAHRFESRLPRRAKNCSPKIRASEDIHSAQVIEL